ncbi:hypothetical protein CO611_09140 [Lysobacteraceae bacterium NML03-0222]|nr:hypothetical protein CO611_09140 [Xanthomonadaceae bacterium NML03-0222]
MLPEILKDERLECLGRFMMAVPLASRAIYTDQAVAGLGDIRAETTSKTVEQMILMAEQERDRLLKMPHETEGNRFHQLVRADTGAVIAFREDELDEYIYKASGYFFVDGVGYVFKTGADTELVDLVVHDMMVASRHVIPAPLEEKLRLSGFCIDSAVVAGDEVRGELVRVEFPIAELPGFSLKFKTYSHKGFQGDDLLTRIRRGESLIFDMASGVSIRNIRKGNRSVAGYQGQEHVSVMRTPEGRDYFSAKWEYQGKPDSISHPFISLDLGYKWLEKPGAGIEHPSQEQILAYWDKVLDSLALRDTEKGIP